MYSLSYQAYDDPSGPGLNTCNRVCTDLPLVINCAGRFATDAYFNTHNTDGREDYYLLYVCEGNLSLFTEDKWINLSNGSFVIFPPKTKYRYTHQSTEKISYLWVHFTGSSVEKIIERYSMSYYPAIHTIPDSNIIHTRFQNIFNAFAKLDKFRENELSLLLERLFISLARRISGKAPDVLPLRKSLTYINVSYNADIRIPELANLENLSVSRYNALFRKTMNMSPVEYITKRRISTACELLSDTDLSVSQISRLVGYSDSHFFSRVFKSVLGVSPREYRKNV